MAGSILPQTGNREDLADLIDVADMKSTPFMDMVDREAAPINPIQQWQVDDQLETAPTGVLDGEDVSSYKDAGENRELLKTYFQWFRSPVKVGQISNEMEIAGVGEGLFEYSVLKAYEDVTRQLEKRTLSDGETQAQSGTAAYKLRGAGKWVDNSAQGVFPVPSDYRTPSDSINTDTAASVTETKLNNLLASQFEQTGQSKDFMGFCGTDFKKAVSDLGITNPTTTGSYQRQTNRDQSNATLTRTIDVFEGDFGTISLVPDLFLAYLEDGTAPSTANVRQGRCYIFDMDDIVLRMAREPFFEEDPQSGGGPRGRVEACAAFAVGNPLKHMKYAPTA